MVKCSVSIFLHSVLWTTVCPLSSNHCIVWPSSITAFDYPCGIFKLLFAAISCLQTINHVDKKVALGFINMWKMDRLITIVPCNKPQTTTTIKQLLIRSCYKLSCTYTELAIIQTRSTLCLPSYQICCVFHSSHTTSGCLSGDVTLLWGN